MAHQDIKDIMDKYDVAGMVILCDTTHTEMIMKLDPTWSAAKMQGTEFRLQDIKHLIETPEGNARIKSTYLQTLKMLMSIRVVLGQVTMSFMGAEQATRKWIADKYKGQ